MSAGRGDCLSFRDVILAQEFGALMERYGFGSCGEVEASSRLGSSEFTTFRCVVNFLVLVRVSCEWFLLRNFEL